MISVRPTNGGEAYYLNVDLIEAVYPRQGNTCDIELTNGKIHSSIEPASVISARVTMYKMSGSLAKPQESHEVPFRRY